jgi:hypothetical protein
LQVVVGVVLVYQPQELHPGGAVLVDTVLAQELLVVAQALKLL